MKDARFYIEAAQGGVEYQEELAREGSIEAADAVRPQIYLLLRMAEVVNQIQTREDTEGR